MRSTKCSSETLQNLLYFMYKKTHVGSFFRFSFRATLYFYLMVYDLWRHRPGHSLVARNEKWKKLPTWVFLLQKYGKFWIISLEHYVEHKPLISEEWFHVIKMAILAINLLFFQQNNLVPLYFSGLEKLLLLLLRLVSSQLLSYYIILRFSISLYVEQEISQSVKFKFKFQVW